MEISREIPPSEWTLSVLAPATRSRIWVGCCRKSGVSPRRPRHSAVAKNWLGIIMKMRFWCGRTGIFPSRWSEWEISKPRWRPAGVPSKRRRRLEANLRARWLTANFGSPTLLAGDFDTSRKSLEFALEIAREHRVGLCWEAEYQAVLAEAYLGLGDQSRARKLADEAIETSIRMETRVYETRSRLARARILLALDGANARAEIESELDCATELVRSTGAISYEPQIVVERARLAKILGDSERSVALKTEAHRLFAAIGATGHAERLARELK